MPDTVLGTWNIAVNKKIISHPCGADILEGETVGNNLTIWSVVPKMAMIGEALLFCTAN